MKTAILVIVLGAFLGVVSHQLFVPAPHCPVGERLIIHDRYTPFSWWHCESASMIPDRHGEG